MSTAKSNPRFVNCDNATCDSIRDTGVRVPGWRTLTFGQHTIADFCSEQCQREAGIEIHPLVTQYDEFRPLARTGELHYPQEETTDDEDFYQQTGYIAVKERRTKIVSAEVTLENISPELYDLFFGGSESSNV